MASPAFFFSFLCILISLLLMNLHPSHSSVEMNNDSDGRHGHHHHHHHHDDDYKKVNVSLYYETLCPGCEDFIVKDLVKVFKTDLNSIVNLHLVPYGNAHIQTPNKTVTCQHGPLECYYNTIEACALDVWPLKVNFPFIQCVETRLQHKKDKTVWESCCKDLKLNPKPIQDCYHSGYGEKLILRNAEETRGLNPTLRYVPWVTVNSKPLYSEYENFTTFICNAYEGHPKPSACKLGTTISSHKNIKACLPN